ncbi:MAG: methyl-accepting chemotaxis protein, partial [bacterium]
GALVVGAGAAFVTAVSITRPLAGLKEGMARPASGDKPVAVPATENRDEISARAKAVQVFKDNALKVEQMGVEAEEQKKAMNELANNFEASVKGVVNAVSSAATEMQFTATSMSAISEETSRQATTVAAAADELSSSIAEIARQMAQAARISQQGAGVIQAATYQ